MHGEVYYPDTGGWAVLGRVSLVVATLALLFAAFAPAGAPLEVYARGPEGVAAFYLLALAAAAAFVRRSALHLAAILAVAALLVELSHGGAPPYAPGRLQAWGTDAAGVLAALIPVGLARFRGRFRPLDTSRAVR